MTFEFSVEGFEITVTNCALYFNGVLISQYSLSVVLSTILTVLTLHFALQAVQRRTRGVSLLRTCLMPTRGCFTSTGRQYRSKMFVAAALGAVAPPIEVALQVAADQDLRVAVLLTLEGVAPFA